MYKTSVMGNNTQPSYNKVKNADVDSPRTSTRTDGTGTNAEIINSDKLGG